MSKETVWKGNSSDRKGQAKGKELVDFLEWIKTVPRDRLDDLLGDAVWKGQLKETEIYRYFMIEQTGTEMISRPKRQERRT